MKRRAAIYIGTSFFCLNGIGNDPSNYTLYFSGQNNVLLCKFLPVIQKRILIYESRLLLHDELHGQRHTKPLIFQFIFSQ